MLIPNALYGKCTIQHLHISNPIAVIHFDYRPNKNKELSFVKQVASFATKVRK